MSLIRATLLTVSCFGFDDFSQTREKLLSAAQQEIILSLKKCFFFFFSLHPPPPTPCNHSITTSAPTPQPQDTKPNEFTDTYAPEQYLSLFVSKKKKRGVIAENPKTEAGKQKGGWVACRRGSCRHYGVIYNRIAYSDGEQDGRAIHLSPGPLPFTLVIAAP